MDKEIFDSIVKGANEGLDYLKGKPATPVIVHHFHKQDAVDIKPIRQKLGMSQPKFAQSFGFSLDSVRNWESGRRVPDTSAQVLLKVIAYNPAVVIEALQR